MNSQLWLPELEHVRKRFVRDLVTNKAGILIPVLIASNDNGNTFGKTRMLNNARKSFIWCANNDELLTLCHHYFCMLETE